MPRLTGNERAIVVTALKHAAPYIRMHKRKVFVLKAGGEAFLSPATTRAIVEQIGVLHEVGIRIVLVHGGGPQSTQLAKSRGIPINIIDGRQDIHVYLVVSGHSLGKRRAVGGDIKIIDSMAGLSKVEAVKPQAVSIGQDSRRTWVCRVEVTSDPSPHVVLGQHPIPGRGFIKKCVSFAVEFKQTIGPNIRLDPPFHHRLPNAVAQIAVLVMEAPCDFFDWTLTEFRNSFDQVPRLPQRGNQRIRYGGLS